MFSFTSLIPESVLKPNYKLMINQQSIDLPVAQGVGIPAVDGHSLPAGQGLHAVDLAVSAYVPAVQGVGL